MLSAKLRPERVDVDQNWYNKNQRRSGEAYSAKYDPMRFFHVFGSSQTLMDFAPAEEYCSAIEKHSNKSF
jgi:hypothetical protein